MKSHTSYIANFGEAAYVVCLSYRCLSSSTLTNGGNTGSGSSMGSLNGNLKPLSCTYIFFPSQEHSPGRHSAQCPLRPHCSLHPMKLSTQSYFTRVRCTTIRSIFGQNSRSWRRKRVERLLVLSHQLRVRK